MEKAPAEFEEPAQSLCSTIFRSSEQNQFTQVTKPIFNLMAVLGLQPFKPRNYRVDVSSATKDSRSITRKFANIYLTFGFLFWLPLPFLGCRATYLSMKAFVNITKKYGFFDSVTVGIMQTWLLVQNGWIFVVYSFVFASKIVTLIEKLDRILLSPCALRCYRTATNRMVIIVLLTIFGYSSVKAVAIVKSINDLSDDYQFSALFVFDLFTLFYFSLLCFIGPTVWLSFTAFFIAQAFRQNRDQLKAAMRKQNDFASIRFVLIDYLRLTEVVDYADSVFSPVVLISACSYVILLCTTILNVTALSDHIAFAFAYSVILLDALLGICLSGIYLNDAARAIQCDVHDYIPESFEVYVLIEKFDRKASDFGWGFTIGKVVVLHKSTFVALLGAMLTFIALWSQFAAQQIGCQPSNSTATVHIITELSLYF